MAMFRCSSPGGGGGSSVTIEYIDSFASGSGSSSKTVNFKTGTYARDDYASLTTDNFLIIPSRSSSGASASFDNTGSGSKAVLKGTTTCYSHKDFTYNASTGVLTFYGGIHSEVGTNAATQFTWNGTANYKIYIIKPGLSQVVS